MAKVRPKGTVLIIDVWPSTLYTLQYVAHDEKKKCGHPWSM